jgi:hypothetical protein
MKETSTGHKINQAQGPRTGNTGTPEKRKAFMEEKDASGSEKGALAAMVTKALETRGRGMRPHEEDAVESLHDNTNVGRGPTKGNAGKKGNAPMGRRGALGATSGY